MFYKMEFSKCSPYIPDQTLIAYNVTNYIVQQLQWTISTKSIAVYCMYKTY